MTLFHEIFDVFNSVVSLVALILIFVREPKVSRRLIVMVVVLLLIGLAAPVVYEQFDRRRLLRDARKEVFDCLQSGARTWDEVASCPHSSELPLMKEATENAVHDCQIDRQPTTRAQCDGSDPHMFALYSKNSKTLEEYCKERRSQ